jgi:hypothetical protein
MSNLDKRLDTLERKAGLGRFDSGLCHCGGPILFDVDFSSLNGEPPEPVEPLLCEHCGREKEHFDMAFDKEVGRFEPS